MKLDNGLLVVEVDGGLLRIRSKPAGLTFVPRGSFARAVTGVVRQAAHDDVWGDAQQLTLTHADGWRTLVRLYPDQPFVHVQTIARNDSTAPIDVTSARILACRFDLGAALNELKVIGTGGLTAPQEAKGSYTFSIIADPRTRHGVVCGWLTQERGVGLFFPSVEQGAPAVTCRLDFGHLRVNPGASRPTETLLIGYFDDARLGVEAYADAVARQYRIEPAPKRGVYCTWYHAGASNEKALLENTLFAARHLKPFGLEVMQIDDGWQAILPKGFKYAGKVQRTGPVKVFVDSRGNYPHGMAYVARKIAAAGMIPGIWFMPFAGNFRNPYFDKNIFAKNPDGSAFHDARWSGTCIDMSNPKAEAFVRKRVKRIYDWGFRYFKIDGIHTGLCTYNIYVNTSYREKDGFGGARLYDPDVTPVEAYRKGLRILREEAPDAFVLGCNVSQDMRCMGPAFGLIDAMRIGPDNGGAAKGQWHSVTKGAWHGTNLYFLNGRIWHNDPDPVYVRPTIPLERARWMCSWMALAGAMHTSSEQYSRLPADRLELLKRCLPSPSLPTRPVDYLETDKPRIWLVRGRGRYVLGLFNWHEKTPDEITYGIGRLGLDASGTYVAFDFWANKFLPPIRDKLDLTVPPASCRVLAVRPAADHPQLLSTSRHVVQCLLDVVSEKWDETSRTLSGTSRVVAGDPYELRIALPAGGTWKLRDASADGRAMKPGPAGPLGLRVGFTPRRTGVVRWLVRFE
ncbi:MAG: alpha-galactosidase [Planctomycetes bacterium]|nr:alpha-galactosidase [Planctomycetota bacterium]